MGMVFDGRSSDSPYVDMIFRVRTEADCTPLCPAMGRWNLLLTRREDRTHMSVEGPLTTSKRKNNKAGTEWLVIRFKFGVFMPHMPIRNLLDGELILPDAVRNSFWLNSTSWQFPDFENVETFVNRLVQADLLLRDPVIEAALQDQPQGISVRTLRRRFVRATGLPQGYIQQIERAQQAAMLLEQGIPILDAVDQAGYADQPHLTRSLKRFIGQTPARIAYVGQTN